MRCPDCAKFVGLEFQEPEVQSLEVSEENVVATIRIVRNCTECGQELKEGTFEMEEILPAEAISHLADFEDSEDEDKHELEIEESGISQIEEGGGRYAKSYFGFDMDYTVKCSCGEFETTGTLSDKMAASQMDSLV